MLWKEFRKTQIPESSCEVQWECCRAACVAVHDAASFISPSPLREFAHRVLCSPLESSCLWCARREGAGGCVLKGGYKMVWWRTGNIVYKRLVRRAIIHRLKKANWHERASCRGLVTKAGILTDGEYRHTRDRGRRSSPLGITMRVGPKARCEYLPRRRTHRCAWWW